VLLNFHISLTANAFSLEYSISTLFNGADAQDPCGEIDVIFDCPPKMDECFRFTYLDCSKTEIHIGKPVTITPEPEPVITES